MVISNQEVSGLTRIASLDVGKGDTTLWVVRHYTGSGLTEVYVIRNQKFLGRFIIQERATIDCGWLSALEHPNPATTADVLLFRKARIYLLDLTDKLWLD